MKLNPFSSASEHAFTLVEMMIAGAIASGILLSIVIGGTALQTTFVAVDENYKANSDQMRVLDSIALDMRRAVSGSVSNSTHALTLTLPDYVDYSQNPPAPRTPVIAASGTVTYGSSGTPPTVVYSVAGSSPNQTIARTYTPTSGPATYKTLTVAAADFQFSCFDPSNAGSLANFSFGAPGQPLFVTARITFKPRYNRLSLASSRTGTTASLTILLRNHK